MYEVYLCNRKQFEFVSIRVTSLPNDKILDWSKLKGFADDKMNGGEKLKFVMGRVENMGKGERVENIVGKGENAGYQRFLLFRQCFQKASFSRS